MSDELRPLRHHAYKNDDDDALAREARQHLLRLSPLQLVGELLQELRTLSPPWWSPRQLRTWWPATTRMLWLSQRPDLRQHITTSLTGLSAKAARKKPPYFQAELLDAVMNEGDITVEEFELSFNPFDTVVYGPVGTMWRKFRAQLPLDDDHPELRGFMAWLLGALVAEQSAVEASSRRKPIITAHELRTAIDNETWHTCMPLELRVAIDDARFAQERVRPGRPFHAAPRPRHCACGAHHDAYPAARTRSHLGPRRGGDGFRCRAPGVTSPPRQNHAAVATHDGCVAAHQSGERTGVDRAREGGMLTRFRRSRRRRRFRPARARPVMLYAR